MRKEYDFAGAKRAYEVPHLACLQAEMSGKTRISIRVDNRILSAFKARAALSGGSYQTLMNNALADFLRGASLEKTVRDAIRESLNTI